MSGILVASALFLAAGLFGVALDMLPLQGLANECIWAGMAISAFPTAAGLDAANG